jgi:hypothetical protein
MSYSRNRTYSTNKKTREVSKLTTKGYVVFIENGESTRRYSRQVIPTSSRGSAFFNGTTTSKITTSGSSDASLEFGTGPFTIEWWQKLATGAPFGARIFEQPRPTSLTPFEVIMAGNSTSRLFIIQIGSTTTIGNITGSLNDTWNHFAIVRSEFSQLKVYRNGVQIGSTSIRGVNLTSTGSITIGNSASGTSANAFSGSITNFHWLKGVAKYTASFTPTGPISPISGSSALLLLTTTSASLSIDSSGYNRTMINTNTSFVQDSPF